METGFRNTAARIVHAEESFLSFAMETANLTRAEALRAFVVLRKVRALKIDAVGGQFTFTHGAFASADVLRRAAQEGR